jgi:hypothetical protein
MLIRLVFSAIKACLQRVWCLIQPLQALYIRITLYLKCASFNLLSDSEYHSSLKKVLSFYFSAEEVSFGCIAVHIISKQNPLYCVLNEVNLYFTFLYFSMYNIIEVIRDIIVYINCIWFVLSFLSFNHWIAAYYHPYHESSIVLDLI